jgi:hypothetical protein
MGKVYCPPDEIKVPEFNWEDIPAYEAANKKFIEDLKQWCVNRAAKAGVTDENLGVVIQFPVADSYAQYMVAALSPVELIHIPLWDAWEYQYVERLSKKDIVEKINQRKAMDRLIPSRG